MSLWKNLDLTSTEWLVDQALGKMLADHPEITPQEMMASVANILTKALKEAPSHFQLIVLESMVKGIPVKLERKADN